MWFEDGQFICYKNINKSVDSNILYVKLGRYWKQCGHTINDCAHGLEPYCVKGKCEEKWKEIVDS